MSLYARVSLVLLCLALVVTMGVAGIGAAEETPPHEHPEAADEDGNLVELRNWLVDYLESSLSESTAALEQGDHDQAEDHVGEEYDERLEQFEDVSRLLEEEEDDDDDPTREDEIAAFEDARDDQHAFIEASADYEATYAEYNQAANADNVAEARELARELEEHHQDAQESGEALENDYETITAETDRDDERVADLEEEHVIIQTIREDIAERQAAVRAAEFQETTLSLEPESTTVSFLDPLVLHGQLQTEDGEAYAGEATFVIEGREVTTTTDQQGQFILEYRPTTTPLNAEQLTVEYVPEPQSPYIGASEAVPVSVEQVEPTVQVTETPNEAAFGDEVTVGGSVGADRNGAEGVPVVIEIGGEHVGTTTTDENGSYALTTTLPIGAAPGNVSVDARVAQEDRALAPASADAPTTVAETDSALTLNAESTQQEGLGVNGRLTVDEESMAAEEGVGNQPIQIWVDGTHVETLRTEDDGSYEGVASLDHLEGSDEPQEVEIVAVYEDDGNVADSRVTTTAEVVVDEDDSIGFFGLILGRLFELLGVDVIVDQLGADPTDPSTFSLGHWIALIGLALALPSGGYLLARRLGLIGGDDESSLGEEEPFGPAASGGGRARSPLEDARARLSSGDPRRAVETVYEAVREELADHTDGTARTHREFYQFCRSNGFGNEDLAALRTLTDRYEQAVFDPSTISTTDAEQAIDVAERLVT